MTWLVFPLFPAVIFATSCLSSGAYRVKSLNGLNRHARSVAGLFGGMIRVRFSDAGVEYRDRWGRFEYGWHAVLFATLDQDAFELRLASERVIIIPVSAFQDNADAREFASRVASRIEAVGGARGAVRAILGDTAVDCPGCGYNLRGVPSPTCPECARVVTPNEVLAGSLR